MSNLFIIRIQLRGIQQQIELVYKSQSNAEDAKSSILNAGAFTHASDDYGRTIDLRADAIETVVLADFGRELSCMQDIKILQEHAQIDLNKRAEQDSKIRGAQTIARLQGGLAGPNGMPLGRN